MIPHKKQKKGFLASAYTCISLRKTTHERKTRPKCLEILNLYLLKKPLLNLSRNIEKMRKTNIDKQTKIVITIINLREISSHLQFRKQCEIDKDIACDRHFILSWGSGFIFFIDDKECRSKEKWMEEETKGGQGEAIKAKQQSKRYNFNESLLNLCVLEPQTIIHLRISPTDAAWTEANSHSSYHKPAFIFQKKNQPHKIAYK